MSTESAEHTDRLDPVNVFVPVGAILNPKAYLLANHDLANYNEKEAQDHYNEFGINENRFQVNPLLLDESSLYRRSKFLMFSNLINVDINSFSSFPIWLGGNHHNVIDYLTESANDDFGPFVQAIDTNPNKLYLDLGCGLRKVVRSNCLYLEVYPSVTADLIVEPTCHYPFKNDSFDGIGCFSVLEHTRTPWIVVREISRILKPGGRIWIDWPFLAPVHGYPSHFFNATREGLRSIFEDNGFSVEEVESLPHQGPDWALHWALSVLAHALPSSAKDKFLNLTVRDLVNARPLSGIWNEVLSQVDNTTRSTLAAGNSLVATKVA